LRHSGESRKPVPENGNPPYALNSYISGTKDTAAVHPWDRTGLKNGHFSFEEHIRTAQKLQAMDVD